MKSKLLLDLRKEQDYYRYSDTQRFEQCKYIADYIERLESKFALAWHALEKIDEHEAKAHSNVGSYPSFVWEVTSRVLSKIRGEL